MPDLSGDRGDDLGAIAAFATNAGARALAPLGHALREEGGAARRARLEDGTRPRHELAVGVLVAGVERLASPAPALDELAVTAGFRARDAEGDRLGRLALRIARAGDELSEAAVLDHHGLAAGRAALFRGLVGGLLPPAQILGVLAIGIGGAREELAEASPLFHQRLAAVRAGLSRVDAALEVVHALARALEVLHELLVEGLHRLHPVRVAFLDLVQRLLALGRELDVHDLREVRR